MCGEAGNLVTHALRGGDGNFINDTFVGVKVECETGVVLLDDGTCGLLNGLGTDSLWYYDIDTNNGNNVRSTEIKMNRLTKRQPIVVSWSYAMGRTWNRREEASTGSVANILTTHRDVYWYNGNTLLHHSKTLPLSSFGQPPKRSDTAFTDRRHI